MKNNTRTLTGLAVLSAIVVFLQLFATFIKFGPFSITLAMVPVVVGAALYGPKAGAYLGGVFGVVVLIACIFGWDAGGSILWNARPFVTLVLCIGKGALAGLACGGAYWALKQYNGTFAAVVAGLVGPVVNTGVFCLAMVLLYDAVLATWAGGSSIVTYIVTGLVGVNFLVEMAVDIVLSPAIVRVIFARKRP